VKMARIFLDEQAKHPAPSLIRDEARVYSNRHPSASFRTFSTNSGSNTANGNLLDDKEKTQLGKKGTGGRSLLPPRSLGSPGRCTLPIIFLQLFG
jgi:hypothetical protein